MSGSLFASIAFALGLGFADVLFWHFLPSIYAAIAVPYWRVGVPRRDVDSVTASLRLPGFGPFPKLELRRISAWRLLLRQNNLAIAPIWYAAPSFAVIDMSESTGRARITLKLHFWALILPIAIYVAATDANSSIDHTVGLAAVTFLLMFVHTVRLLGVSKVMLRTKVENGPA